MWSDPTPAVMQIYETAELVILLRSLSRSGTHFSRGAEREKIDEDAHLEVLGLLNDLGGSVSRVEGGGDEDYQRE